jgi:hypothetical protein
LKSHDVIFLERLNKTTKNLSHNEECPRLRCETDLQVRTVSSRTSSPVSASPTRHNTLSYLMYSKSCSKSVLAPFIFMLKFRPQGFHAVFCIENL